jgi:hypothetical protein
MNQVAVNQVVALSRMRFSGYARSQRVLAPVLASLAMLAVLQVGGAASAVDAYGVSAVGLFGIFAWQSKLALDTEPDAQRQLSYLAVGSAPREVAAGLLAAGISAVPTIVLGLVAPWITGTIEVRPTHTTGDIVAAVGFGIWVHLISALPAVAVGAFASRAVTRARGWGVSMLVGASVLVLVLGLNGAGPLRWLVPQIVGAIKAGNDGNLLSGVVITVHAVAWSLLFFVAYLVLRARRR